MMRDLQKDRALAFLLLAGVVLLAVVVTRDLGGGIPEFPAATVTGQRAPTMLPPAAFTGLFEAGRVPRLTGAADTSQIFYTTHFQPPPVRPPTTRRVDLTYLGYVESGEGRRLAYLLVGEKMFVGGPGSNVIADLTVARIDLQSLLLTNSTTQSNLLPFKAKTTLEVPIP